MFWLLAAAHAGGVYVNEVRVNPEDLAGNDLKGVTVRADAHGNIFIDAPGYTVRQVPMVPGANPLPAIQQAPPVRQAPPVPVVKPVSVAAPVPRVNPVSAAPPVPVVRPVQPAPPVPVAQPTISQVPAGTWWLYIEDEKSRGHTIDVEINGVIMTTVVSGTASPLKDIGRWLRYGANTVRVKARSTAASGGPLYIYIGRGDDQGGTVDLGKPAIQFGVGQSRSGVTTRDYTLEVN